jgi:hypothetical protein
MRRWSVEVQFLVGSTSGFAAQAQFLVGHPMEGFWPKTLKIWSDTPEGFSKNFSVFGRTGIRVLGLYSGVLLSSELHPWRKRYTEVLDQTLFFGIVSHSCQLPAGT